MSFFSFLYGLEIVADRSRMVAVDELKFKFFPIHLFPFFGGVKDLDA